MSRRSYNIDSPSTAAADALYHGRGPSMDERLRSGYTPPKKKDPYDVSGATSSNRALRRNQPQYDEEEEEERPPLAIPKINRDNLSEDDGLLSPRRISQQMGAFGSMLESGAGWGSAMIAALQGHQMTEEQAAICLQSHARRKSAADDARRAPPRGWSSWNAFGGAVTQASEVCTSSQPAARRAPRVHVSRCPRVHFRRTSTR